MRTNTIILLLFLTACVHTPADGYANPGDPERQLTITTEASSIDLTNREALELLKESLKLDPPLRAQLNCPTNDALCTEAKKALIQSTIPLEITNPTLENASESGVSNVTLIYENLQSKPCDHKYKDNSLNSNNIAMPQLGCSIRSNMQGMVTDKQQFVNPALLDYFDGEKAAKNYQSYSNPPAAATSASQSGSESLIDSASSH